MHPYYYFRNGQGNIIGLFDGNGTIVARYSYDSWGNLLSIKDSNGNDRTNDNTFIGYKNPIRYRGYYYDSETKLYYLQSRYYNPEWGRFLNADGIIGANGDLTSNNLFAYCSNNPVMFADPSGYCSWCGNPSYNAASMSSSAWERHVQKYSPAPAKVTVTTGTKNDTKNWVLRPNEVIVIDKRDNIINNDQHDPNFIILNSYAITDKETMRYIANYLIVYDCENPTEYKWGRTADSIVFEWEVHNNYYYNISFSRSSTTDVDLNTLDEGKSGWDFFIDAVQKAFNKIF